MQVPNHSSASALRGLWFVFKHEGHKIALWVSSLTGKEEVYVDSHLVATRRKISLTSVHTVCVNDHMYTISLTTLALSKGCFQATLLRSGEVVQAWRTSYKSRKSTAVSVLTIAAIPALLFVEYGTTLPSWLGISGLVLVSAGSFAWSTTGAGYGYAIEEVAITLGNGS